MIAVALIYHGGLAALWVWGAVMLQDNPVAVFCCGYVCSVHTEHLWDCARQWWNQRRVG